MKFFCSIKFFFFEGYLRPSRELLEFYRRKIAQYDTERDDLIQKLDRCKVAYEEKVALLNVCLSQIVEINLRELNFDT